jgi:hypothetical protein
MREVILTEERYVIAIATPARQDGQNIDRADFEGPVSGRSPVIVSPNRLIVPHSFMAHPEIHSSQGGWRVVAMSAFVPIVRPEPTIFPLSKIMGYEATCGRKSHPTNAHLKL